MSNTYHVDELVNVVNHHQDFLVDDLTLYMKVLLQKDSFIYPNDMNLLLFYFQKDIPLSLERWGLTHLSYFYNYDLNIYP